MTSLHGLSHPARLLGGLAALLSLTACPDEGIVDPFASSATDSGSSGMASGDDGALPTTTAPGGGDTSTGGVADDAGPLDSSGDDGDSSTGGGSTTGMVSGGSGTTTGDSMEESSSGGESTDGGNMATPCPVEVITELPFSYSDSIAGEENEFGGPCGGSGAPDHAYTIVAPSDGFFVFDTFGSSFDTVLYVLDGDCGGSPLACDDDTSATQSEVSVQLTAGQTITLVVDSFGLSGGNYTLNGTFFGGSCPDGDIGSAVPQTVMGNTADDGDNTTEGSCGGGIGFDDSYTFTAPADGVYSFDSEGSAFDTVLYAFDGDCNGPEISCNDDTGAGDTSRIYAPMAAGEQVVVVVDGAGAASGAWQLNVGQHECPAADLGSTTPQTNLGTTSGLPNVYSSTCAGGAGPEIGLLFTAPADATYVIDTGGTSFDTVLSVLDGPGCAGTQLACNDDAIGLQSAVSVSLTAGQQVSIMVDGYGAAASGNYTLNIVQDVCPEQDLGSTAPLTTMGTTAGATGTTGGTCGGGSAPDVAHLWEAPAAGSYTFDTYGSGYDTLLYVLDGATCGGPSLGCNDDTVGLQSEVTVNLAAGQQVVVVVDGYSTNSGPYVLNID